MEKEPATPTSVPETQLSKREIPVDLEHLDKVDDVGGEGNKKRSNWSKTEDEVLARSFVTVSNDPINGNEQKADDFWGRVASYYNENHPSGSSKRNSGDHVVRTKMITWFARRRRKPQSPGKATPLRTRILYASLGSPPLPGWISTGGDPCGQPNWQGVECVNSNITSINLSGANLGGELGSDLGSFASIMVMSLNNNQLTGSLPDAFEQLKQLINMDLSGNIFVGLLPSSMGNLSSLTTLHLQNNQLSGMLDVLQDLPLVDLNIENNLFSGPIPSKLINIPNFRSTGNPFNTTMIPPPPSSSPLLSPLEAPSPWPAPSAIVNGPPAARLPESGRKTKHNTTSSITWIPIVGLLVVVALALGVCFFLFRCCRRKFSEKAGKNEEMEKHGVVTKTHKHDQSSQKPLYQVEKVPKDTAGGKDHRIDMTGLDSSQLSTSHPPFPFVPSEKIPADRFDAFRSSRENASKSLGSANFFTVASLQQCTNSFSQENLIGNGMLGTVFRAQLPDGKVLAVKKLEQSASEHLSDSDFLELVASISRLQHPNIVKLVGYCLEHGQRLLVYEFCHRGTLNEALHLDDEIKRKLSWNTRMIMALQAAKALEYLHEVCQPPVVHRNFKSTNVLLNDDLSVQVSDCGLAPLLSSDHLTQLQGYGYGAPELETGSYSKQSDVYSFGVVMLELLTGRKSYDRFRSRGSQYLARWALPHLYDIDSLSRMVEPSLKGAYPSKSLSRLADIITLCIQPEPEFRPPMSEIVRKLSQLISSDQ
ncbi:protein STRUBBELIG-receptor FAMILY 3 [Dorcoceras hygrometricum]|uniref:Protein STRUBBELIG-receptor FAMILY 3 n=1 Tax=Dorcoceras hygrometricum TaxID=472368 RepID=A0A2Z6ZZ49_9LAMI|nr:protein STRUBBELIG-receptor FAMILY 3 [Dorcoceras hygrometricum]